MLPPRLLLENTSDGVLLVDAQLTVRLVNDAATLLYRRTRAELVGRTLSDLFPELVVRDGAAEPGRERERCEV